MYVVHGIVKVYRECTITLCVCVCVSVSDPVSGMYGQRKELYISLRSWDLSVVC